MARNLESILKRDRLVVAVALATVAVLAWAWLLAGAGMEMTAAEMTRMAQRDEGRATLRQDAGMDMDLEMDMDMPMPASAASQSGQRWTPAYIALMFTMWWVMMIAMMLPSATPMVLLAATVNRKAAPEESPYGTTANFVLGYLLAWALFSAIAVLAQYLLAAGGLLTDALRSGNRIIAGALLIAAGLWQFTPIKNSCLAHCRSPVTFLTERRRRGHAGAVIMGFEHGAYCLGCCWFLMALLFVGGVMNLYWIVGLAAYVLAEKILPAVQPVMRIVGIALTAWGVVTLVRA
jgi:predicted metal-binding membrane protein